MEETSSEVMELIEGSNPMKNRLGDCEVCAVQEAKYTCPRCEVKTCCLKCVNIHKTELKCSGERNKLLFKPLSKMGNLDLLSDYRLLEDVTRNVERIRKHPVKRDVFFPKLLPNYFFALRREANKRGMRLHFLPRNFTRARENSSRYMYATNTIEWRIDWVFSQADLTLTSNRLPETLTIGEALSPFLNPENCKSEIQKEKLQFYYSAGIPGICALLRVGEVNRYRYHDLDVSSTLKTNLIHKSIIEFPTIIVILKDHKYAYEIYNSDDEDNSHLNNGLSEDPSVSKDKKPVKTSSNSERVKNFFMDSDSGPGSDEETDPRA